MSDSGRKILTTGRLDGLIITPFHGECGRFLAFTVDSLPGLRLVVEIGAARELRNALTEVLELDEALK